MLELYPANRTPVQTRISQWTRWGLWTVVILFLALAGATAGLLQSQSQSASPCSPCIQQELRIFLGILAPIGVIATSGLAYLTHRANIPVWPVAGSGFLVLVAIVGLTAFGSWIFRNILQGQSLSKIVWWM